MDAVAARLEAHGYVRKGDYLFPERHVVAQHLEHADPSLPKMFVSELRFQAFSPTFRETVGGMLAQVPDGYAERDGMLWSGAPWNPISIAEYELLARESEYGAWVAAFGTRANHFTVLLNALRFTDDIRVFNAFITDRGYRLNMDGGAVKGSPEALLEQSSIMAPETAVAFADGTRMLPGCFYEFAKRYPDPEDGGRPFSGFVERSADRIFSSTDRK
jgi:hypothetical protein